MANTFDPQLVNKILSQRAITKLQHKLAYLPVFTNNFSDEFRNISSRTVLVPFISGASPVQVDPVDFEVGDNAMVARTVQLQQLSKTSSLTYVDVQNGLQLEKFSDMSIATIANKIESMVFSLITEANYSVGVTASLSAGITGADLKTLWSALPGDYKAAILADSQFAKFLPNDLNSFDPTRQEVSILGYDYFSHTGNGFASAGPSILGFAAMPNAICLANRIPEYGPGVDDLLDSVVVSVPEIGLSIQSNIWGSAKGRTSYHSFDTLFGCSQGDPSALKIAKVV
jgi:hypothetical protein